MSVSAHLTPEPERRLWLILENVRHAADAADLRIAGLAVFAFAEIGLLCTPRSLETLLLVCTLPLVLCAAAPLERLPKWLRFLDRGIGKMSADDCLVWADDLTKYSHGDLIVRFDKYLGGGITATPYYEDLVGQIAMTARVADRKRRLLRALCLLLLLAQLSITVRLMR